MTESKRGRPASTPDLDRVVDAINAGKYDERLLEVDDALENRREHLKAQLLERVRKVFGPDADVVMKPKMEPMKPLETSNPFVNRALRGKVVEDQNNVLPGPYKTNPDDDNSYRMESDYGNGMIEITDIMGGHSHQIPKAEWDEWSDSTGDRSALTGDANPGSAPFDFTSEHRGPIIGGLGSHDMIGTSGRE